MTRLFLDANVLFKAAHNPDGKAALVVEVAKRHGHWEILTSDLAIEEARRNLSNKFPAALPRLEQLVAGMHRVSPPPPHDSPIPVVEKDRPILYAAIVSRASRLLTGDRRHLGPHMNRPELTAGVTIQTVAEFLESLPGPGSEQPG